jgi:hypothetical protein
MFYVMRTCSLDWYASSNVKKLAVYTAPRNELLATSQLHEAPQFTSLFSPDILLGYEVSCNQFSLLPVRDQQNSMQQLGVCSSLSSTRKKKLNFTST